MAENCVFCMIIAGGIPSTKVAESATAYAFRDINPAAPVHVLVVPKRHEPTIAALGENAPQDLLDVFALVREVTQIEGVGQNHRLMVNTGADAGQTVFHAHVHVLGGKHMDER